MNTLEKILNVTNQELNNLDTSFVSQIMIDYLGHPEHLDHSYCFHSESGREHYRLLSWISTLFENQVLFDIGTNRTMSALALSYNKNNKIKSYDIVQTLPKNPVVENIEFIIGDSTLDADLMSAPLIFLDVDHDGIYEKIVYDYLKSKEWEGILMLDDIHLNDDMRIFWNHIEYQKFDLTKVGHWSGTGMVLFGEMV